MAVTQAIQDQARDDAVIMLPLLDDLETLVLDGIVRRAALRVNQDVWGAAKAREGVALLICHYGQKALDAVAGAGGATAAGPVASVTMGKLAVSFAAPAFSPTDAALGSTDWGLQYLALRKSLIIPPLAARRSW